MPAANVRTYEKALVPRVAGNRGVYNAILIPGAKKGPIGVPVLVNGENDLLNKFTPNGTIKVGYNIAYYSALAVLQQTNTLWTMRVANGALNGGAFSNVAGSEVAYSQMDETSAELKEITFDVSGITDGSDEVQISNIVGGTPDELVGRTINIEKAGKVMYDVVSVSGSTLTLDGPVESDISFVGTGLGSVAESSDFISFDADFGVGGASLTVEATNLSSGTTADLDSRVISFVADGVKFTRTVTGVAGTTLTLDSVTPSISVQNGSGYRGAPEYTASVTGIVDGATSLVLADILPAYITITDFEAKTLEVVADMSDTTTLVISSNVSNASGASIDFDTGVNNPDLIDTSYGEAPFTEATADGFVEASSVNFPTTTDAAMKLFSINEGDWSKDVRVEIITENQRTEGSFTVNVYDKNDINRPLETFVCAREVNKKDGYGRNIFIDVVLQGSNYINSISNAAIDEMVMPEETVIRATAPEGTVGAIIDRKFIKFVGGFDGNQVTPSDMISGADVFNNKNNYPLSVFLDGGYTEPSYQRRLVEICEIRDDSMAILSVPYELEVNPVTYVTDIVNYKMVTLNVNSSFGAIYSSHVLITDKYNDRQIYVAPDGFAAAAINLSASNYEIWYPPAGFKRGRLFVDDVHVKFTDADLDYLADNGVNQIRFAPGKGIAIWGQLTLSMIPSAFDRINTRLLLNTLKPEITAFLEQFLFELNTGAVRQSIKSGITDYLVGIHSRDGVSDFKVVCDGTNNSETDEFNYTLNVDVYIQPIYSIEYINFTTVIKNNSVSFNA